MPTSTHIALANTTLASAAGSITFSSIPATYRDLVVVIDIRGLSGAPTAKGGYMMLNGTNGSDVYMQGGGSGSGSSGSDGSTITVPFANNPGVYIVNVMDYSATNKHKTILGRHSAADNFAWVHAGRVATTNAITSVTFVAPDEGTDTFNVGSTFALYGIVG